MSNTAAERRYNFLETVQAPIVAAIKANGDLADDSPLWQEAAKRLTEEGPALGRTERWQQAMQFFTEEQNGSWGWTVRQGVVWACYAAE